ncbi:hypothetical protein [Cupriavidus basilensis]|uniref:hypothetical protein n=1 Tax=Cupriavidus basilensis TaxID=68895 RepID=UPI0020A64856|nr:hypothetical protein [Cupriavidus basilensis]MCP3017473.1 hypothetical protein [Cupriavidus basilensis]
MRSLKGLLRVWAVVILLLFAGFLFAGVTPWLINQRSDLGIPLVILMWSTFIYCVGVIAIKLAYNNKEKK